MIKILHIVGDSMSRAGMETFIMNLYRCLDTKKFQFDFLVHSYKPGDYDEEILQKGGAIYRVIPDLKKPYPLRVLKRFSETHRFLKSNKNYDAVHIHTSAATSLVELLAAYYAGCRIRIVHSHSTNTRKKRLHKVLYPFVKYYSSHQFACSNAAGIWMFGKNFNNLSNSKIVFNGIDTNLFYYNSDKQLKVKKRLNLEKKLVVGHIGRFNAVKNHHFIIDVFQQVYEKRRDAVLLLIGDGDLRPGIEDKVSKLNLSHCVKFAGVRDDINELLLAMDIMLYPSFYEGLPVALIEAQATGLKITASAAVSDEVNITGLVKYLSLDRSAAEWSDQLLAEAKYIRHDQSECIKKANYDIGGIAGELCSIYGQK